MRQFFGFARLGSRGKRHASDGNLLHTIPSSCIVAYGGRMALSVQLFWLFVIAIPIASVAWTITHEEVFSEPRQWCERNSKNCRTLFQRKFFYLFTCEYCFSHWVTAFFLIVTRFKLIFTDWRGYLIAGFSLVWIANVYMSFFARIRLEVKRERVEISVQEKAVGNVESTGSKKSG
jgi:hypothetical protein